MKKLLFLHILFLFEGLDSIFFEYQNIMIKVLDSYVDYNTGVVLLNVVTTLLNAFIILFSLNFYWPSIITFFKKKRK